MCGCKCMCACVGVCRGRGDALLIIYMLSNDSLVICDGTQKKMAPDEMAQQ